ncbi:hypothetical protein G9A89_022590 [Geosiphon pyriformis]|nr:hypothetical protein G9A89_022590 [Geosiphon pyriformis]
MEDVAINKRQTLCLIIKELNSQQNYVEDTLPIIKSTKHYHLHYLPSLFVTFSASCKVINPQRQNTPKIHKSGNYWNSCATDTERLEKQIHQSLLGYSTAITTQTITKTLCIIDTNIKYYMAKQFLQVQQPVKSNPEEYKNKFNNPITAQAKSTVNKKPRFLSPTTPSYHQTLQSRIVFNSPSETQSETPQTPGNPYSWNQHSWTKSLEEYGSLFGNFSSTLNKTDRNMSMWELLPTQPLTESSITSSEETAILQPIGKINKRKQPELAPGEHSSMQTPNPPALISKIPPTHQIMAYRDIAKLEKFSNEEDDAYIWIVKAEKAITANNWDNNRTIQPLPFFLIGTADSWYQSFAEKPIDFTAFKLVFLQYFCDPNTLIRLQNQFSIIKQKDHKVVTTYFG